MSKDCKQTRVSLVRSLTALIPQKAAASTDDVADREVRCHLRALRDALQPRRRPKWAIVRSSIARLRGLYLDEAKRESFPATVVEVLRQLVEAYPFLTKEEPKKEAKAAIQGGKDQQAVRGFEPQHRSRFHGLVR
jgi:hypothetical protein